MSYRRWFPWPILITAFLAVGLFVLAACEEEEEAPGVTPAPGALAPQPRRPDTAQELQAEVAEPVNGVIETSETETAEGLGFFTKNNLKVPLGQTVTIRFKNEGVAVHNLRIAGVDGQWNTEDDLFTSEDGEKPGEVAEIEFTPQVPGIYVFRCDFHPGDAWGQIVVE